MSARSLLLMAAAIALFYLWAVLMFGAMWLVDLTHPSRAVSVAADLLIAFMFTVAGNAIAFKIIDRRSKRQSTQEMLAHYKALYTRKFEDMAKDREAGK